MTLRGLVFTPRGALRSPWRLAFFFLAVVASALVAATFVGPVVQLLYRLLGLGTVTISGWVEVVATLLATWLVLRHMEKRPWSDVGLDRAAARPALLGYGLIVGTLAIGVPVLALIGTGWLARVPGADGSWWPAFARISMSLLPAALFEELLIRGYFYTVLRQAWGWRWAILATSLSFAALHVQNAGVTIASLGFVALAGIWLGLVREHTGSLYAAWLAHFAWNWVMAALAHTPVSGHGFEAPGYRYVDAGPDWATGGAWGPEGGLPAGIGMLLAVGYLYARRSRSTGNQE